MLCNVGYGWTTLTWRTLPLVIKVRIQRQFDWWALPPKFRKTYRKLKKQGYYVQWYRKYPEDVVGNSYDRNWTPHYMCIGDNIPTKVR